MIPRAHHLHVESAGSDQQTSPVVIAVFDTGVDPNAAGLQVTSTGLPKILDLLDCSGAGDTKMVLAPVSFESSTVAGLSGRLLKIPSTWLDIVSLSANDSKVRVGLVEAYRLFPKPLIKQHRKTRRKAFLERNRAVELQLQSDLLKYQSVKNEEMAVDFELRLKELASLNDKFSSLDDGPLFDVIMFKNDAGFWQIALDTSETGDFSTAKLMGEYRFKREFSTFGHELLSYSFNVYDDGDVLSVVTVAGSHGTHVAGISAACFPDQPELNGINPSAQIISMKIGDTRLGSMETNTAMMRAFVAAVQAKVDIINMSYGEPTSMPNQGRVCELLREVVNKYNIIFVGSAGNAGPAFGTVGAPAGTTDAAISVGAFVSSEMAEQLYSVRDNIPSQQTTWSSRGPSSDGGLGVTVSAPGAAIAPVPTWTLNNKQLMNGTSMSSPNAAGAISNLLALARQQKVTYSVARIRKAIENTATSIKDLDSLTIGHGLLNSQQAAEHLLKHRDDSRQDIRFQITVGKSNQGIYLRDPHQINKESVHSIKVVPHIPDEDDNTTKSKLELHLSLTCDASWVSCPVSLCLHNEGRSFSVSVNPSELESNQIHYTEIVGTIDDAISNGPVIMFRVPITVIIPRRSDGASTIEINELQFKPGTISRHFLSVPSGAVSAHITISSHGNDDPRQFVLHTLYNENWRSHRDTSLRKYVTLQGTAKHDVCISVKERTTLEVALAQFWSALGDTTASLRIEWCGLSLTPSVVNLSFADRIARVEACSLLRTEYLNPGASISSWSLPVNPISEGQIRGLTLRDTLPEQRHSYELILTYKFTQMTSCSVTIEYPLLNSLLYESDFDSQMCQIFDSSKKMVHLSDAFPKAVTLEKGDYTVRIQVKHEDRNSLVKLQSMPIDIVRKLPKAMDLEVHRDFTSAVFRKKAKKSDREILHLHESSTYFVTIPDSFTNPKGFTNSSSLIGCFTLLKQDQHNHVVKYPLICRGCLEPMKDKSNGSDEKSEEEKTPEIALRDCIISWINKQQQSFVDKYCGLGLEIVLRDDPRFIPGLLIQLKGFVFKVEQPTGSDDKENFRKKAIDLSSAIIESIDINALASSCGIRPPQGSQSQTFSKTIKEKKKWLISALSYKAFCLLQSESENERKQFEETMNVLHQWIDIKDSDASNQMILLNASYYRMKDRLGQALQLLDDNEAAVCRDKALNELRRRLLEQLQWSHWIPIVDNRHLQANPSDFALF